MKYIVRSLLLLGCTSFASIPSRAQIQINALGSYVSSVGERSPVSNGLRGFGGSLRYFTSSHVAVGLNAQHLTKTISNGVLTAGTKNLYVAGQAEYFVTTSAWQPYVGVEVGLVRNTYRTELASDVVGIVDVVNEGRNYYFNLGPRAGIQYMITPSIGINAEATYKLIVDRGSPENQTLLLGGGVVFKIGNRSSNQHYN